MRSVIMTYLCCFLFMARTNREGERGICHELPERLHESPDSPMTGRGTLQLLLCSLTEYREPLENSRQGLKRAC